MIPARLVAALVYLENCSAKSIPAAEPCIGCELDAQRIFLWGDSFDVAPWHHLFVVVPTRATHER